MIFTLVSALCVAIDASCCNVINGIQLKKINKYCFITSLLFALFQGIMLLLGYLFANIVGDNLIEVGKILSFLLLLYLSGNLFYSLFKKEDVRPIDIKNIIVQAVATSIDAISLGIVFRVLDVNISFGLFCVMIITLILSCIAFILGIKIGDKVNKHAKIVGALILLLLAFKILLFS